MERKKPAITRGKIKSQENRYIMFSKRKAGIFKKVNELVTLCGAEIGIVIFSPTGKPYSYGHPSIKSITNQFQNQNPPMNNNHHALVEVYLRGRKIEELNERVDKLYYKIEKEKQLQEHLLKLMEGKPGKNRYDKPIDDLSFEELEKMSDSLKKLYQNLCTQGNTPIQLTNPVAATSSLNINKMNG